jgi:ribosomal protein S28E/S33
MTTFSLNRKARRAAKFAGARIDHAVPLSLNQPSKGNQIMPLSSNTNRAERITANDNQLRTMRNLEADAMFKEYWLDGYVGVQIVPAVGPDKGIPIVSFTPRKALEDWIRRASSVRIVSEPTGTGEAGLVSIQTIDGREACRVIKRALLNPALQNQDFLDDIVILGALWLAKGKSALEGSGVAEIGLLISHDESLPWHQRGMLDPDFAAEFITPKLKIGSAPPATPSRL